LRDGGFVGDLRGRRKDSPLAGARVAISERSIDKKGIFTIVRHDMFDIIAGAFLSSGALLLLERSFNRVEGMKIRLRNKVDAATTSKGKAADGDVLLEAALNYQVDNMEGLDAWVDNGSLSDVGQQPSDPSAQSVS